MAAVLGVVVFGIGSGGLDIADSRLDHLATHGVRVTATVIKADTYNAGYRFESHLIVDFDKQPGGNQRARIWIGQESYFVGQHIPVVYDPASPSAAQLGDTPQVGPVRFPLLVAEIVGGGFLLYVAGGVIFALIRRLLT